MTLETKWEWGVRRGFCRRCPRTHPGTYSDVTLEMHTHVLAYTYFKKDEMNKSWYSSGREPRDKVGVRPVGNTGANLKTISHRCCLREVAFEWEFTEETIYLRLGCLQGGGCTQEAVWAVVNPPHTFACFRVTRSGCAV